MSTYQNNTFISTNTKILSNLNGSLNTRLRQFLYLCSIPFVWLGLLNCRYRQSNQNLAHKDFQSTYTRIKLRVVLI